MELVALIFFAFVMFSSVEWITQRRRRQEEAARRAYNKMIYEKHIAEDTNIQRIREIRKG